MPVLIDTGLLLRLFFAHFITDFVLQNRKCAERKQARDQRYLVGHSLLQGLAAYAAAWNGGLWWIVPAVGGTHYVIDLLKSYRPQSVWAFAADQCLHIAVLTALWLGITGQYGAFGAGLAALCAAPSFWKRLVAFVVILKPASVFLALCTRRWRDGVRSDTLKNAGQWIGYLERILILIFIWADTFGSVGYLLAAKSIFRFGELKDAKDIKTTEYIMIGTLASFTIAIAAGLLTR